MSVNAEAFAYQTAAKHHIRNEKTDLLLLAAMSGGKTSVALDALTYYGKGAFVAPSRPLCYQHYRTLCEEFGAGQVCIGTGDYALGAGMFRSAPYRVVTFFKLMRLAVSVRDFVDHCPIVILDEVDDMSPWYQMAVTLLKTLHPKVRIMAMTGTMNEVDIQPMATWLRAHVIRSDVRPTELFYHMVRFCPTPSGGTRILVDGKQRMEVPDPVTKPEEASGLVYRIIRQAGDTSAVMAFAQRRHTATAVCAAIAEERERMGTVPVPLSVEHQALLAGDSRHAATLRQCLPLGVGLHHGGLPAPAQHLVSDLLAGNLDSASVCFGLNRGVNYPVGNLIITSPWDTDSRVETPSLLTNSAFLQVAARAGRVQFGRDGHIWIVVHTATDEVLVREVLIGGGATLINRSLGSSKRFASTVLSLVHRRVDSKAKLMRFLRRSLWGQTAAGPELKAMLDEALSEIRDCQIDLLSTEGQTFKLTKAGELAARVGAHPLEFDLILGYTRGEIEYEEWLSLLSTCYAELEGAEETDLHLEVLRLGLGVFRTQVDQNVKNFAEYVQRMLERCEAFMRFDYALDEEVADWRTRIYKPFVCGSLPLAQALYDVVGRKAVSRLLRQAGHLLEAEVGSLDDRALQIIARLLYRERGKDPNEDHIRSCAAALGADADTFITIVTNIRKEVLQ